MIREILDPSNYSLTFYAIPPLFVGVLVLLLGILVLIWERASLVSRIFLSLTACGAMWLVGYSYVFCLQEPVLADWWVRFAHAGISFIPTLIFLVTLIITHRLQRYQSYVTFSFMISSIYLASLWTPSLIAGVQKQFWGYYPYYGPLGLPFLVFFWFVCLVSFFILWNEYRNAMTLLTKQRCKHWMLAFGTVYVAGIDFLPAFGIPVYPAGYLPVIAFIALAARTIRIYHLADITPAFAAKQILQTMENLVFVVDLEGKICVANRAACEMLGYQHSEVLSKNIGTIIEIPLMMNIEGAGQEHVEMYDKTLLWHDAEVHDLSMTWIKKDGKPLRVSVSAAPLRGNSNRVEGIVYAAQDITRRLKAEAELKENEEKFRSLAQSANDAVISADSKGRIIFWNKGAQAVFGYTEKEVLGQLLSILMPERFREAHQQGLENFVARGEGRMMGKTLELIALRKSGEEFPAELSLSSWKSAKGVFFSGILRDISERKRLEEERQRFFELSPDLLCVAGFDGYFKQLNSAWEKTLGWKLNEVMREHFTAFIHPEDLEESKRQFQNVLKGESVTVFECRFLCKDGSYRWLLWNAIPLVEQQLIYAAARDVTETKKAREMRLRLAFIVDSTHDAIISVTPGGLIRTWNHAAEKIYGYLPEEIIGLPVSLLYPPEMSERVQQILAEVAGGKSFENVEMLRVRKDGTRIWVSATLSPIKDESGKIIGISSIGRDVTRLKEAEEAMRQKKDVEMKSQFISMVSHELRTPLTAMKMGMDILNDEEAHRVPDHRKEWLEMVTRNLDRLTRLIDKVLDFQKLDAGKIDYEFQKHDLNVLVRDVSGTMKLLADKKGLRFECFFAEDLPEISMDKDRISEVLMNFLSNAIKFTEKGSVAVRTAKRGENAEISITDTGVGIKQEDFSKLFTFFKQVGPDKKTGGSGLGLAISKKIVQQHGGMVWVDSAYGRGSTFSFSLPFQREVICQKPTS